MLQEAQDQLVQLGEANPSAISLLMLVMGFVLFFYGLNWLVRRRALRQQMLDEKPSRARSRWWRRQRSGELSMFAKKRDIEAMVASDAITEALERCILDGSLRSKTVRKLYRRLGTALDLPDLLPGLKPKAYQKAVKKGIQHKRLVREAPRPAPIPEPVQVEPERKLGRLQRMAASII